MGGRSGALWHVQRFHPLFEIVKDLHSLEYEVYCRHGLNTSSESSRCGARSAHAYSADAYPAALQHSAAGYDVYMHACASVLLQHNIAAFLLIPSSRTTSPVPVHCFRHATPCPRPMCLVTYSPCQNGFLFPSPSPFPLKKYKTLLPALSSLPPPSG